MMKQVLLTVLVALALAGAALAAEDVPQGRPIPYRVIPMENLGVQVKNWSDEADPHYDIIAHPGEWQAAFAAIPGRQAAQPDPNLFKREQLIAVSRVSDAVAPGQRVLVVKSLLLDGGELILTYSFIPPARKTGQRVKNTLLIAIPAEFQSGIRFIEEIETPESMAAAAELEEARRLGRTKPPPMQMPMPNQR